MLIIVCVSCQIYHLLTPMLIRWNSIDWPLLLVALPRMSKGRCAPSKGVTAIIFQSISNCASDGREAKYSLFVPGSAVTVGSVIFRLTSLKDSKPEFCIVNDKEMSKPLAPSACETNWCWAVIFVSANTVVVKL